MYSEADLRTYAGRLLERRNEGVIVQPAEIQIGDWLPQANECHKNVATVCANRAEFTPAHGWLFFDFMYALPYVLFNAHSVIQSADGHLFDITPSQASQPYPFIRADENDEDFVKFVSAADNYEGVQKLKLFLQSGAVQIIC